MRTERMIGERVVSKRDAGGAQRRRAERGRGKVQQTKSASLGRTAGGFKGARDGLTHEQVKKRRLTQQVVEVKGQREEDRCWVT